MTRPNVTRSILARSASGRGGSAPWRTTRIAMRATVLGLSFGTTLCAAAFAQDPARLAAGEGAWDKAGCLQCHGASGEGGAGAEFPAGPSLRTTRLDRTALVETISCGLPGTP